MLWCYICTVNIPIYRGKNSWQILGCPWVLKRPNSPMFSFEPAVLKYQLFWRIYDKAYIFFCALIKFQGHVLDLSVHLLANFNIACKFWSIQGMLIPWVKHFQMPSVLNTLWPWPFDPWQEHGVSETHFVLLCSKL